MSRRFTRDEFIARSKAAHGDFYDYSRANYVDVKTKVTIVCPRHGPFLQAPEQHMQGSGCRRCAVEKRRVTMLLRHGVEHALQSDAAKAKSRETRDRKFGCQKPPGSGRKALGTDTFIERAREIHGDRYDYSLVEYVNNSTKVRIICPVHGVFEQTPAKHLAGRGCPNPECIDAKRRRTSLAHYGVDNPMKSESVKSALAEGNMARFGVVNPMQCPEIRERLRRSNQEAYGVGCTFELDEVKAKGVETKRANNSFGTSGPEDELYAMLVARFGDGDVVRQYRSDAYPYACDFYVPSRDMYIELNGNFTHGGHWYTGARDDQARLAQFEDRLAAGHGYYRNAINVWTVDDVRKRESARAVNLNYVVFWGTTLWDARLWFDMGCPDGRDWEREYSWMDDATRQEFVK